MPYDTTDLLILPSEHFLQFLTHFRMVNALERLTEEVKCVRVQGKGKIYIQQKGLNLILGIPGPDNSVWSGGLFSIIIRCSESKSFYNYVLYFLLRNALAVIM